MHGHTNFKFVKLMVALRFIVGGRIILRWIFRKLEGVVGTRWSWLRIGTGGGHL
jgi:NADH:ubiquinone oxidoreductase subunit H